MAILITGAAGFIGSHLAEELITRGEHVAGVDNLSTGSKKNLSRMMDHPHFDFIEGDISNPSLMDELISSCDTLYHLAASVGVKLVTEKPASSLVNNMNGIGLLLELSKKYKVKLFFASSSEVYGKANGGFLCEGDDLRLGPPSVLRWGYGCSKAMAEYLALSYYKQYGLSVTIGRFFNICGPRQIGDYGMVMPRFVASALKGEPITVFGDGRQVRSFTSVTDAVHAVIGLMNTPGTEGEVFNVGNTGHITIGELAEMVKEMAGSSSSIDYIPYTEAYNTDFEDMMYRVPDISKIKAATGFRPQVNLETIVASVIEYWKGSDSGCRVQGSPDSR